MLDGALNMNVKEQREMLGLSQAELAEKTGIPRERISKWEQRNSKPKFDDYKILEEFFKKSALNSKKAIVDKSTDSQYNENHVQTQTSEGQYDKDAAIFDLRREVDRLNKEADKLNTLLKSEKEHNKQLNEHLSKANENLSKAIDGLIVKARDNPSIQSKAG
jgi:transcriptional regulator with XRE-family HTH domain